MNRYFMLAAPAAIVVASAAYAAAMSPRDYVMTAGASDLFERQSAQLVMTSTTDPKIRAFAREMVKAHTTSTAMVKAAAARAGLRVTSPMLTPEQQDMLTQLRAVDGTARDTLYLSQQRMAHDQALAVQQSYARDGTAPALRAAAAKIVPVVKHHIAMLGMM